MKICKNCGRESEEGKIRCPYCGYLFEDEMDSVLREMNLNLNSFKQELSAPKKQEVAETPAALSARQLPAGDPVLTAASAAVEAQNGIGSGKTAQQSAREQEELKLELANLKGQLSAMQGELGRMSMQRANSAPAYQQSVTPPVYQQPAVQPAYYANTYGYPAPVSAEGVYSQAPVQQTEQVPAYAAQTSVKDEKKARSKNRIVLALIVTLLLAASIASFFFAWISYQGFDGFTGIDALENLFGMTGGEPFEAYLNIIRAHEFAGSEIVAKLCLNLCYYIVKYGIVVYAALLILGLPILFSVSGRIRFKTWHCFFAWIAAVVAALLFGMFFWVSGFSSMTFMFLGGAAANVLRGFFLLFYSKK